jgi:tRNA (guanosine-2'-O-)-methyltransferase
VKSETRTAKIDNALAFRQAGLTVILENIHDTHNVNAILRSCDAVGVTTVHFLYTIEKFPKLAHVTSSGAYKWLDYERWDSVEACFGALHDQGFQILGTKLEPGARQLYAHDLARPTAIVMGNEHRGISAEAEAACDELIYIPMLGMVESLNVSVAAAVTLFEAMRQRSVAGLYDAPQLTPEALRSKKLDWLLR